MATRAKNLARVNRMWCLPGDMVPLTGELCTFLQQASVISKISGTPCKRLILGLTRGALVWGKVSRMKSRHGLDLGLTGAKQVKPKKIHLINTPGRRQFMKVSALKLLYESLLQR